MFSPRIGIRGAWRAALPAIAAALACAPPRPAGAQELVATIGPVHSLAASVMQGHGEPALLLRGYGSPHAYQLRPSSARLLARAGIVVWVGEGLETFLASALPAIGSGARVVELATLPGMTLLPARGGGVWAEGHAEPGTPPAPGGADMHLWLDPGNAARIGAAIADALAAADPPNAAGYRRNLVALQARLAALDEELARRLAPVRAVPFVVFHDAYQYLERRYRLSPAGAVTVSPERIPSARRIRELRARIVAVQARCLFREPQFESALAATLVEGTGIAVGVLDPLGADIEPGPDAYFELLRRNADAIARCLGR